MSVSAPDDAFLDINDAHLRVYGNVHADGLKLGQLEVVTTTSTGSTINFLHQHTAFTTTSNILVGTTNSDLFVDTLNSRVGILTSTPATTLDVNGTVKATSFSDGTSTLTGGTWSGSAASLTTAVNIGGVSFDGSASISLPGVDLVGDQNTTGSAAKLTTPVNIGGVAFDGSASIVPTTFGAATFSGDVTVDTNTFHVDTTNNRIGIGTDSPSTRLQVNGDSAGTLGDIAYFRDSTGQARVVIRDEQSSPYIPPGLWTGSGGGLAIGSQFDAIKFYSTANGDTPVERMRIVGSNGNIGIGTTNPEYIFDIQYTTGSVDRTMTRLYSQAASTGTSYTSLRLEKGTGGYGGIIKGFIEQNVGAGLSLNTLNGGTDSQRLTIIHNGNVGINQTSPYAKLDVNGFVKGGPGVTSRAPLHISDNTLDSTNGVGNGKARFMMVHTTQDQYYGNEYGLEIGVSGTGNSLLQTIGYTHNPGTTTAAYNLGLQPFSGNVGVGTYSPLAKLQVSGTGDVNITNTNRQYFRWDYNNAFGSTSSSSIYGWGHCSIYASGAILSGDHIVSLDGTLNSSDERIKKNIVDADDAECLKVLRQLKPKKYQYKDEIKKGREPVWGFIAQEVRETLPYATQLRRECIPNIYELANVSDSRVITFINFDTSDLESNAMVLKVFDKNDTEHLVNITEVVDEHTIRVEEDLSEWTDTIEESEGEKIFVFGQQVDDFHFLKKDAIWTVATAALQEVDRQLQAEKARNDALEARIAALENNISS